MSSSVRWLCSILLLASCTSANGSQRDLAQLDAAVRRLEASQGSWVLWREHRALTGVQAFLPYTAEDAYATKQECVDHRRAWLDIMRSRNLSVDGESYRDNAFEYTLYCLPDRVDPWQFRSQ